MIYNTYNLSRFVTPMLISITLYLTVRCDGATEAGPGATPRRKDAVTSMGTPGCPDEKEDEKCDFQTKPTPGEFEESKSDPEFTRIYSEIVAGLEDYLREYESDDGTIAQFCANQKPEKEPETARRLYESEGSENSDSEDLKKLEYLALFNKNQRLFDKASEVVTGVDPAEYAAFKRECTGSSSESDATPPVVVLNWRIADRFLSVMTGLKDPSKKALTEPIRKLFSRVITHARNLMETVKLIGKFDDLYETYHMKYPEYKGLSVEERLQLLDNIIAFYGL